MKNRLCIALFFVLTLVILSSTAAASPMLGAYDIRDIMRNFPPGQPPRVSIDQYPLAFQPYDDGKQIFYSIAVDNQQRTMICVIMNKNGTTNALQFENYNENCGPEWQRYVTEAFGPPPRPAERVGDSLVVNWSKKFDNNRINGWLSWRATKTSLQID